VTEQGIAGISSGRGASIRSLDFTQCDPDEEADPVGTSFANNGLTYDALTDTCTYVWKTDKCWKGKCGMFTLKLDDGSEHTAEFVFK
jgi:hypothetical protein